MHAIELDAAGLGAVVLEAVAPPGHRFEQGFGGGLGHHAGPGGAIGQLGMHHAHHSPIRRRHGQEVRKPVDQGLQPSVFLFADQLDPLPAVAKVDFFFEFPLQRPLFAFGTPVEVELFMVAAHGMEKGLLEPVGGHVAVGPAVDQVPGGNQAIFGRVKAHGFQLLGKPSEVAVNVADKEVGPAEVRRQGAERNKGRLVHGQACQKRCQTVA